MPFKLGYTNEKPQSVPPCEDDVIVTASDQGEASVAAKPSPLQPARERRDRSSAENTGAAAALHIRDHMLGALLPDRNALGTDSLTHKSKGMVLSSEGLYLSAPKEMNFLHPFAASYVAVAV